jgi:hypothetical protein
MRPSVLLGFLAVIGLGWHSAQASSLTSTSSVSVLYSGAQLVQGSQAGVTALNIPSAGELFLTLTDLQFPDPFSSLKFDLTDTLSSKTGLSNPGILTLDLTGPATLYANVFATAGGSTNLGLYNLTATFLGSSEVTGAPVPLPATGALLAAVTSLAVLFELVGRRRTRTTVTTAVA